MLFVIFSLRIIEHQDTGLEGRLRVWLCAYIRARESEWKGLRIDSFNEVKEESRPVYSTKTALFKLFSTFPKY